MMPPRRRSTKCRVDSTGNEGRRETLTKPSLTTSVPRVEGSLQGPPDQFIKYDGATSESRGYVQMDMPPHRTSTLSCPTSPHEIGD